MNKRKLSKAMKGLLSFTLISVLNAGCSETGTHDDSSENSNTVESGENTGKTEYAETEVVSELDVDDAAVVDSQGNVTVISEGEAGAVSEGNASDGSTESSPKTDENTETGESSEETDEYAEGTGGF